MDNEIKVMLKKVTICDLIVGISVSSILFFLCPRYSYIFLIGILVASINFIANGIVNSFIVGKISTRGNLIVFLSVFRIFIIGIVGALLFKINNNNGIFYIMGFCSHFISLIIYGFWNNIKAENK
ncbi:MAG: hypothetical protein Q8900_07500 [Bacillota bacterium]|nr:hypothetical protein [Bacillota bacterium]